jgi:gentisate 1,2-dioxygenase
MGTESDMSDATQRERLRDLLEKINCRVHQPDDPPLFTRTPQSTSRPVLWRWSELLPMLDLIGEQIKIGSGGQRRTLRLANPGLPFGTTPTFWASIQYINPGEVAEAHRHAASAFRFIMKGTGCSTTVDGERYSMNEGDLVLTPSWAWHDHVHEGSEPMIWLDVLDISLVRSMHSVFFEPYPQKMQPVSDEPAKSYMQFGSGLMRPPVRSSLEAVNPLLVYPAAMARSALQQASYLSQDSFDDVILEYQNPTNGAPAMTTMGMTLQCMRPGFRGNGRRQAVSKLLHFVEGRGRTVIDGEHFEWSAGDFLFIPPWTAHEHQISEHDESTLVFTVSDAPAIKALGLYREQCV